MSTPTTVGQGQTHTPEPGQDSELRKGQSDGEGPAKQDEARVLFDWVFYDFPWSGFFICHVIAVVVSASLYAMGAVVANMTFTPLTAFARGLIFQPCIFALHTACVGIVTGMWGVSFPGTMKNIAPIFSIATIMVPCTLAWIPLYIGVSIIMFITANSQEAWIPNMAGNRFPKEEYERIGDMNKEEVIKSMMSALGALTPLMFGGIPTFFIWPWVEDLPGAGCIFSLYFAVLTAISERMLKNALTVERFPLDNPSFVTFIRGFLAYIPLACKALMESFRFAPLIATVILNPGNTNWNSTLATGLVTNLLNRLGWLAFITRKLSKGKMGIESVPAILFRHVQTKGSYTRLVYPEALMLGRMVTSSEPAYVSQAFLVLYFASMGYMIVEDVMFLGLRHLKLEAPVDPELRGIYEEATTINPYNVSHVWVDGQPKQKMSFQITTVSYAIGFLLATHVAFAGMYPTYAILPQISWSFVTGQSHEAYGTISDGALYWPQQNFRCC